MRAVVQRTDKSSVKIAENQIASIGQGLTVLLGVGRDDTEKDVKYLVEKIINLRIFDDAEGKLNLSLVDIKGEMLVVSQFTLFGDCRKGRRPSFIEAASPEIARKLYQSFILLSQQAGISVASGKFQTEMLVSMVNHGPVTILLDSKHIF